MRSRERLRRIEREIAAVEIAARDAGLTYTVDVEVAEKIVVAELIAGAAICAACPESSLADPRRVAGVVADRLRELQAITGESGPALKARVRRLFDDTRGLRGLTPGLTKLAAPIMRKLLADVAARWVVSRERHAAGSPPRSARNGG